MLGLSAILRTSATAYTIVKYAGALYLLYLGVQTIRQKEDFDVRTDADADTGDSYRRGVMVNTLNPKVAVFFLAFLPQFVTPGPSTWLDMLLLGVLYATLTLLYLGSSLTSSRVKTILMTYPRTTDAIRWAAGSVIVGLGIELAVSDKPISQYYSSFQKFLLTALGVMSNAGGQCLFPSVDPMKTSRFYYNLAEKRHMEAGLIGIYSVFSEIQSLTVTGANRSYSRSRPRDRFFQSANSN